MQIDNDGLAIASLGAVIAFKGDYDLQRDASASSGFMKRR
jgi:hypothetical protein